MKEKIVELEGLIEQSLAQHNFYLGAVTALREAVDIGQAIAPENPLVEVGENILEAIEDIDPSSELSQE